MTLYILYGIWILIPLFFLAMSLWVALENIARPDRKERPGDYLRQGLFVAGVVAAAIGIDQYALKTLVDFVSPDPTALWFARIILLPLLLFLSSRLIGPTEPIRIENLPTNNKRGSARRGR